MTTDRISPPTTPRTESAADTLLDGLFTGMIGAITVAIWFLILDVAAGRPLYTPALLGQVLMHGPNAPATEVVIAPIPIAAYTAFHFVAFLIAGVAFAYLMNVFERFPIMFFVLLVAFLCLQIGVFAVDVILGSRMIGRLQPWAVIVANVLAAGTMVLYQWRRHPSVLGKIETLWEHEKP